MIRAPALGIPGNRLGTTVEHIPAIAQSQLIEGLGKKVTSGLLAVKERARKIVTKGSDHEAGKPAPAPEVEDHLVCRNEITPPTRMIDLRLDTGWPQKAQALRRLQYADEFNLGYLRGSHADSLSESAAKNDNAPVR